MKLESVFRIGSINIRRIQSNWIIISPIKTNLGRINVGGYVPIRKYDRGSRFSCKTQSQ
jgi:hypothetical protein